MACVRVTEKKEILKLNLDYFSSHEFDSVQISSLVGRCPPILIMSVMNVTTDFD